MVLSLITHVHLHVSHLKIHAQLQGISIASQLAFTLNVGDCIMEMSPTDGDNYYEFKYGFIFKIISCKFISCDFHISVKPMWNEMNNGYL